MFLGYLTLYVVNINEEENKYSTSEYGGTTSIEVDIFDEVTARYGIGNPELDGNVRLKYI